MAICSNDTFMKLAEFPQLDVSQSLGNATEFLSRVGMSIAVEREINARIKASLSLCW